jgi:hypothetical protein
VVVLYSLYSRRGSKTITQVPGDDQRRLRERVKVHGERGRIYLRRRHQESRPSRMAFKR